MPTSQYPGHSPVIPTNPRKPAPLAAGLCRILRFALTLLVVAWPAAAQTTPPNSSPGSAATVDPLSLALTGKRWTGDLDVMVQHRTIRALVVYSKSGFFYDAGQPHGTSYEALQEFQRLLNLELHTGSMPVIVTFLPVEYDQLEQALLDGAGDLIAFPVVITPEREKIVNFTTPILTDVRSVVVTGPGVPAPSSLDDLSGKDVYVNPLSVHVQELERANEQLRSRGLPPIRIVTADNILGEEDLLEMVNAGLIPATVSLSLRADFWTRILPHLHVCKSCSLGPEESIGWVMRKDSPKLKAVLDRFVVTHREGTSFGNTLLRRYFQNTHWVTSANSTAALHQFDLYINFFKKYASEYDFDYLMLVALSYQESGLEQDRRNPSGAVGLMQVIPRYAAASPIDVPSVSTAEPNIHAGTKMLRVIADTYLNEPGLDPLNRTLLTFASYNAGPNRIASIRKDAARHGLNPNLWFGNVEIEVSRQIGQETVRYVGNIYKYYVAYKLILEQEHLRRELQTPR